MILAFNSYEYFVHYLFKMYYILEILKYGKGLTKRFERATFFFFFRIKKKRNKTKNRYIKYEKEDNAHGVCTFFQCNNLYTF